MKRLFILFFFVLQAEAQTLSWPPVTENEDGSPAVITSYRLYYRLVTENPEACEDDKCSTLCKNEEELIHNIELPAKTVKYDLQKDAVFKRGAMYQVRIAALSHNIESQKSKATACVPIRGVPEEPDYEAEGDENEQEFANERRTNTQGEENEEVKFASGFVHGFINPAFAATNVRPAADSDTVSRHGDGRSGDRSGRQMVHLLGSGGHPSGRANSVTFKSHPGRTAATSSINESPSGAPSARRELHMATNTKPRIMAGGKDSLYPSDRSLRERKSDSRIYGESAGDTGQSLQDVSSGTSAPKVPPEPSSRVVYWLLGIAALLGLVFWAKNQKV